MREIELNDFTDLGKFSAFNKKFSSKSRMLVSLKKVLTETFAFILSQRKFSLPFPLKTMKNELKNLLKV
jgi:hypothetical protein